MKHLILNLESPLVAFGGETIDNLGVIRWFPSASMLTGLLANALGWRRMERGRHQQLQDRLVFAARIDREPAGGVRLTDFQTAQLAANDKGWTTRGAPDDRAGGANTYNAPHLRYRDYFADMCVTVALRLGPDADDPTLDDLADALQEPARPLFIGRKPCLPSAPLVPNKECIDRDSALAAVLHAPMQEEDRKAAGNVRVLWPENEDHGVNVRWPEDDGPSEPDVAANNTYMLTDQRNWVSGLHGGGRPVWEGVVGRESFTTLGGTPEQPGKEQQQ